ncbi:ABC transporter ATP-binding protein [Candidatus Altiarchaeota archaeon]
MTDDMVICEDLSFWYPERMEPAISDLSLRVGRGEFMLLTGSSGSGKSTLCRILNALAPKYSGGRLAGRVTVDGMDVRRRSVREMSDNVGFIFQDPEDQFVMGNVGNELAFGLENKRMSRKDIGEKIASISRELGIADLLGRRTQELSGGQKQKVVLASVLALEPPVLVLDEPTSQLDPDARHDLLELIGRLHREKGLTVLMVEHNLDDAARYADSVFDMDTKKKTKHSKSMKKHEYTRKKHVQSSGGGCVLKVKGLSKSYGGIKALTDVNLEVGRGQFICLSGANGSGKTTLAKHMVGLLKPEVGGVTVLGQDVGLAGQEVIAGMVGYVPQDPQASFFHDTVLEEVAATVRNFSARTDPAGLIASLGLAGSSSAYPRDLSVGERQRLAIACAISHEPEILVLDEPTRGIDPASRNALADILFDLNSKGATIILVTQDQHLAAQADRIISLASGRVK